MGTKITLSDKELELVCNTDWILTKHAVMHKVYGLFGEVAPLLESYLTENKKKLPEELFANPPKISKGENYKLLPYAMLDYPRYFGKEDTVAIRTFFWWGNFFSVSLQLAGDCKANAVNKLQEKFEWLGQQGYFICVNETPWQHHFEKDNFIAIDSIGATQFSSMLQMPFMKVAKKIPLSEWENVPGFIVKTFIDLALLLKKD